MITQRAVHDVFIGLRGKTNPVVVATFAQESTDAVTVFLRFVDSNQIFLTLPSQMELLRAVAAQQGWPADHDRRVGFRYDPDFPEDEFAARLHRQLGSIEVSPS